MCKRIKDLDFPDPCEVIAIVCDQRKIVDKRSRRDDTITQTHSLLLTQPHSALYDHVGKRKNRCAVEESLQPIALNRGQLVISEHFDITDNRSRRGMHADELPQRLMLWLGGVDDDVAIKQHRIPEEADPVFVRVASG